MRGFLAMLFYASAIIFLYCGFALPGAEGLNHHIQPRGSEEILAALMILNGCAMKLAGHVMLFSTARRTRG